MRIAQGVLVGIVASCQLVVAATSQHPAFYPADAARGSALAGGCVACHGSPEIVIEGLHVPKLGGQRPDSIFDALHEYKSGLRGNRAMAAIAAALSDQEMRDVAAYLAGADIRPSRDAVPDNWAHRRVHEDCAGCHGETGIGVMPGYPVLGGQYEDYLIHALESFRNGERQNPTMNRMARGLSDEQIRQLAQYFSERGYLRAAQ